MSINENKEEFNFDYIFKIVLLPLSVLLNVGFVFYQWFNKTDNFSAYLVIALAFINLFLSYVTQKRLKVHTSTSFMTVMLLGAVMILEGGIVGINSLNIGNILVTCISMILVALGTFISIYYYKRASIFNDENNNDHNGESILA